MATSTASAPAPPARPSTPPSGRGLAQMVLGNQVQQAIYVAAKLGLADVMDTSVVSADELAEATGTNADALFRLLRALTGLGIVSLNGDRQFSLTPLGALLRNDHPQSVRSFALWSGGVSYQAFAGLEETIRTGEPAFERVFGMEFFDYLATHPDSGELFDEMMARHTAPVATALAGDALVGVETIADLGGGRGNLLAALLAHHPGLHGILVEHPRLRRAAARTMSDAGVADRCEIVGGDMFESVPAADAYILKSVVHGLHDADAKRLLETCRASMRPGGRVLLVEMLMPNDNDPGPAKLMDLLMLVGCHGRERTEAEFATLLGSAGLALAKITPTKHAYVVITARTKAHS